MIIRNAARCRSCLTTIESTHTHDFRFCPCGSIFIDGGTEYLRRGGSPSLFEDLSEVVADDEVVPDPDFQSLPPDSQEPTG